MNQYWKCRPSRVAKVRTIELLGLIAISLSILRVSDANAQSTNLDPVHYYKHSDISRIESEMKFLEQRVMTWDSDIFRTVLDSLVIFNNQVKIRSSVADVIDVAFDCHTANDSLLIVEYTNRGDFYSFFRVSECVPQHPVTDMTIGDTVTVRLKLEVASDVSPSYCLITIKKLYDDVSLPVVNFRIIKLDYSFIEAISSYTHSYIVKYVGERGGMPTEWKTCSKPYSVWDFQEDSKRECSVTPQLKISDNTLQRVPIEISVDGDNYVFQSINSQVVVDNLELEVAGYPTDVYATYDGNISNSHTLFIRDNNWDRILIANLQSGSITSQPFNNAQSQKIGQAFGRLGPISISDAETVCQGALKCVAFDNDSSVLHTFELDLSKQTALAYKQRIEMNNTHLSSVFWSPPGNGNWLHIAGTTNDTSYIAMGFPQTHRRYIGYVNNCDSAYFNDSPVVSFPSWFTGYAQDMHMFVRGNEQLGIVLDRTRVLMTRNQQDYYTPGLMNEFIPVKSEVNFTCYPQFARLSCISRLFDGQYMVVDNSRNLIHIIEPYDGKYVCSWSVENGFNDLLSCRQVVDMVEDNRFSKLYEEAIVDLFTLEEWHSSSGISRFLTDPEILDLRQKRVGGMSKPDIISLILTARTEMDINLVDDQLNVVSTIESGILRDPRYYEMAIDNPSRYNILLSIRSADNNNYAANMHQDRSYIIAPDGTISIIKLNTNKHNVAIDLKMELFPNPVQSVGTLHIRGGNTGSRIVALYNTAGQLVRTYKIYLNEGEAANASINFEGLPKGAYFLNIAGGRPSKSLKVVYK